MDYEIVDPSGFRVHQQRVTAAADIIHGVCAGEVH